MSTNTTFAAAIIADSVTGEGHRLTTLEVTFPRFILAEFNTHRMLSRNSASSRAVPTNVKLRQVRDTPFVPDHWGSNRRGMQAGGEIEETQKASSLWLEARDKAMHVAAQLLRLGVHKQLANRVLEPFSWHTALVTATDWDNFFHLRMHPDAQPEFCTIATLMHVAMKSSAPNPCRPLDWHLPYTTAEERLFYDPMWLAPISAARCARVSYLSHNGESDINSDISLAERLRTSGHMSPFEHPARAQYNAHYVGNFHGWMQYRKFISHEHDPLNPRYAPRVTSGEVKAGAS